MNILVIGASQGTGKEAVKSALHRGHRVTAFARSPERLAIQNEGLRLLKGDILDAEAVTAAVKGHDAVVITASLGSIKAFKDSPDFFSKGTAQVISAMKDAGTKRLVILSALGTGESRVLFGWLLRKLVVDGLLKYPFRDHDRQESLVRESDLDWVIARPSRLTDGKARGLYRKTAELTAVPGSISRADVADFLVESCTSNEFLHRTVHLGG
jgi:putative NADH-flavin reductase